MEFRTWRHCSSSSKARLQYICTSLLCFFLEDQLTVFSRNTAFDSTPRAGHSEHSSYIAFCCQMHNRLFLHIESGGRLAVNRSAPSRVANGDSTEMPHKTARKSLYLLYSKE